MSPTQTTTDTTTGATRTTTRTGPPDVGTNGEPNVGTNRELDRLLDDELAFSPSFGGIYSNHLAMALVALHQLGAPPEVLRATFDAHAAAESEPRDDTDRLAERFAAVQRDGIAATVRSQTPALVDAPSTALFHPIIRLAYALDVGHEGQVAAALLDWQRRHQPLPLPTVTITSTTTSAALRAGAVTRAGVPTRAGAVTRAGVVTRVSAATRASAATRVSAATTAPTANAATRVSAATTATTAITTVTGGDRRSGDMARELSAAPSGTWLPTFDLHGIARHPRLRDALDGLAADERTLDDLSAFALGAHLAADAFVTLHIVTGARAVRAVSALLDEATAVRLAHQALRDAAVVYAAAGAPPLLDPRQLDRLRRLPLPTPAEIADRAIHDADPHVIKLANVALVEEERTGDPLYRFGAAHVVGAVPAAAAALS